MYLSIFALTILAAASADGTGPNNDAAPDQESPQFQTLLLDRSREKNLDVNTQAQPAPVRTETRARLRADGKIEIYCIDAPYKHAHDHREIEQRR